MKRNARAFVALMALSFAACKKDDTAPETKGPYRPVNDTSKKFISRIYEYQPAPGQFTGDESFGTLAGAQKLIGGFSSLLSLGGYGGYVIFGFDHSIDNKDGNDLGIYGNPLVNVNQEWSEPGIVMVMQDLNGNGLPDDTWYELAGSEYSKAETIKKYKITYYNPKNLVDDIRWKDNQGRTGYILRNPFHDQNYFPVSADTIVFEGTLLKNTLEQHHDPVYGIGLITNKPVSWGYSDNGSAKFLEIQGVEGRGYNVFDISWAVNKDGQKVSLPYIDFVKVYTGQNSNGDPGTEPDPSRLLGEISTEVSGAIDLHFKK